MPAPAYLEPYIKAARRYGSGFGSLLWASRKSQAARFRALLKCGHYHNRVILDAGCGRADFLDFLLAQNIRPKHYVGIEAMHPMAAAAEKKAHPIATITRGDFVQDRTLLDCHPEIIIFCGSLNTLPKPEFYSVLRSAWQSAKETVAFNFLSSDTLAKAEHLTWHPIEEVHEFARSLTDHVLVRAHYMKGDCTIALRKTREEFNSVLTAAVSHPLSPSFSSGTVGKGEGPHVNSHKHPQQPQPPSHQNTTAHYKFIPSSPT
jgi:hypothetical protein